MIEIINIIKHNRKEQAITNIIEQNCIKMHKLWGTEHYGMKFVESSSLLYWSSIMGKKSKFYILTDSIIKSNLFNHFEIIDVVKIIDKHYNTKKYELKYTI